MLTTRRLARSLAADRLPRAGSRFPARFSWPLQVALAVLASAGAVALSFGLSASTGVPPPLLTGIAAVLVVAAVVGAGPGLLATAVVAILHVALAGGLEGEAAGPAAERLRLLLFLLTGALASGLAWLRARAERRIAAITADASRLRARADLAARRLEALQASSTELADAATTERIAAVLLHQARRALRADEVVLWVVDEDRDELTVLASLQGDVVDGLVGMAMPAATTWPPAECARRGRSIFAERLPGGGGTAAAPAGADPAGVAAMVAPPDGLLAARSAAAVPLALDADRRAVLSIAWTDPVPLPSDRRLFILALARVAAAALDRNRLLAAETAARRRAEVMTRHLHVLADAGQALGATLDQEVMLRRLPGLAVPHLGDLALVDVSLDGRRRRLAAPGHPDLQPYAVALRRRTEPDPEGAHGQVANPIPTAARVDAGLLASLAGSAREAAALEEIAPRWLLEIPLLGHGRSIGRIVVLRREDRPFDAEELAVGMELGQRAGRALEHARMVRQIAFMAHRDNQRAAELEAVLAAVEDGFVVTDADGRVRSANRAAEHLFGGPAPTLPLLLARVVDADGGPPDLPPGRPVEVQRTDDRGTWLELARYEVRAEGGDERATSVLVVRDVTAFRRARGLQEAFFSLLSHELRTPVTTIYAGASLLTRTERRLDPAAAREVLDDMAVEADRLYRLVEDLMVLARFDASFVLAGQPVLIQHLVTGVVGQERNRWPSVSIRASVDPAVLAVAGDETAISQVVRNLISNAAKYSPPGGEVVLEVSPTPDGTEVLLEVRDDGPGVAPAEAERVFDPFYRSPMTAGLAGGAGIGLYVSRRLAEAMGGTLDAVPVEGALRGGRFQLRLPQYALADVDEPEEAAWA